MPITSFGVSLGSFLLDSDVIVFDGFLRGIYICVCVGACEIDLKREVGYERRVYAL